MFIEPAGVAKYYEKLQLLKIEEENEVYRILYTLSALVLASGPVLYENLKMIEKLDFIFSKGKLSIDMDATEPAINTERTDAIKNYIIPNCNYRDDLQWLPYAEEADLLNVALFGFTAKAWRESNPELAKSSNVRDYATINELTVLSNLETHNAQMIREGKSKEERFQILKEIADYQMQILSVADKIACIEEKNEV